MKLFRVNTGFGEVVVMAENEEKAKETAGFKIGYVFTKNFKVERI